MTWFVARLLSRSVSGKRVKLAEDSFRLIQASSLKAARRKAERLGKKMEFEDKNYLGQKMTWEFVEVLDCYDIEGATKLKDGMEIYSLLLVPRELKAVQEMFTLDDGKRWVRDC